MGGPFGGAFNAEILHVDAESFIELVLHLILPLLHHSRRAYHQHPPGFPTPLLGRQQQPDLNGLAKPHIIGD